MSAWIILRISVDKVVAMVTPPPPPLSPDFGRVIS